MAESTVVRELVTLLGFEVDEAKMKRYDKLVKAARKNLRRMAIAGGLAAGAVAGIAAAVARAGDDLAKTSRRLGLSIEALQEWRFAAQRGGIASQTFDMAIQRFGRRAAEAARGTGAAVGALGRLRVQTRDANGQIRSMDDLLQDALAALADIESPLERNALAMKLFDSEGVKVVQMLEGGSKALAETRAEFRKLGAIMDDQTAKVSEETVDAWGDLRTALFGVVLEMGTVLMPIVRDFLKILTEWIARNRTLLSILSMTAIALTALSAAIFGIIAVKQAWLAVTVLLSKATLILLGKLLLILGVLAAIFLIGEDIAMFISGKGDTLTGRFLESVKELMDLIWERVVTLFQDARAWLVKTFGEDTIAALEDAYLSLIGRIKTAIMAMIDAVLPEDVKKLLAGILGGGPAGPTSEQQLLASRALLIGRTQVPTREEAARGLTNVNITVNAAPGQTPGTIAAAVASEIADDPVLDSALAGLKR
jgi:hypothetical protein